MKIKITDGPKTIISNPTSKFNFFAWPSVARLPNGKIAVVCSGYRLSHICPFRKAVMALSDDNGESYTGAFPIIDTPQDDRDAGIVLFGENGVMVTSVNLTREHVRKHNIPWLPDMKEWMHKRNLFYHAYLDTVTDEEEAAVLGATFRFSFDG